MKKLIIKIVLFPQINNNLVDAKTSIVFLLLIYIFKNYVPTPILYGCTILRHTNDKSIVFILLSSV